MSVAFPGPLSSCLAAGGPVKPSRFIGWVTRPRRACGNHHAADFGRSRLRSDRSRRAGLPPRRFRSAWSISAICWKSSRTIATPLAPPSPFPWLAAGCWPSRATSIASSSAPKKGQVVDIRVFARQIGSPVDPQISVHRADGGGIAGNDDSGGPDSYLRIAIPDDGEFAVAISDQLRVTAAPTMPTASKSPR